MNAMIANTGVALILVGSAIRSVGALQAQNPLGRASVGSLLAQHGSTSRAFLPIQLRSSDASGRAKSLEPSLASSWLSLPSTSTALFGSSETPQSTLNQSKSTIEILDLPDLGTQVTLVGTAHLSKASNEEVQRTIESTRPDVVMIELDPTRLPRIGYETASDVGLPVVTSKELGVRIPGDTADEEDAPWFKSLLPQNVAKNLLLDGFATIARKLLTGMYDDMSSDLNNSEGPGGEFVAAIDASKSVGTVQRIVLGDRESIKTIRRAAQLVMEDPSTSPGEALNALGRANQEEISKLEHRLQMERPDLDPVERKPEWSEAVIEEVKADSQFRERLFQRLEREVPAFIEAFLHERDVVMASAIHSQAMDDSVKSVVAVVGLAHVAGIRKNLENEF